jgi:hypothetical protein
MIFLSYANVYELSKQMSNLGGGIKGVSPQQTLTSKKDSEHATVRSILRNAWNGQYATNKYGNSNRVITPFRAVNNSGDFLARQNYSCGGPNPTNKDKPGRGSSIGSIVTQCDNTGVPASSCNVRFVADSSDYVTFKKQQAMNKTYNDAGFGGDQSNASFVPFMRVRR